MPDQLAGLGPERQNAGRVQAVEPAAIGWVVGLGIAGAPVDEVKLRVIRAVLPCRSAAVFPSVRNVLGPGLGAWLAGRRSARPDAHGPRQARLAATHSIVTLKSRRPWDFDGRDVLPLTMRSRRTNINQAYSDPAQPQRVLKRAISVGPRQPLAGEPARPVHRCQFFCGNRRMKVVCASYPSWRS